MNSYSVLRSLLVATLTIQVIASQLVSASASGREPAAGSYDHMEIACGSASTDFAGRVVHRSKTGEILLVRGVRFTLCTHGTVHCSPNPTRIRIRQGRDGRFSYPVILWSDTIRYFQGEARVSSRSVDDKGTMLLQAKGCDDLTIEFDDTWSERDLEMSCPNRE